MIKIFEALEEAHKRQVGIAEQTPLPLSILSFYDQYTPVFVNEMIHLHRNIDSLLPESSPKIIQFIGSQEGEGTSTVARDFAWVSSGEFSHKVLLLDGDSRHPTQQRFFNITLKHCLSEGLRKGEFPDRAFCQIDKSNVFFSLLFDRPTASLRAFDHSAISALWQALKKRFDLVVIDSPPVNTSPESLFLFQGADGIVMVLEAEKTRWPVAAQAKERIIKNGGNILGLVFNKRLFHIPDYFYKWL